jgi:signal transduction histidine kinase
VRFLPRSISLAAELVIVLVSLIVATTVALTVVAYRSSVENLEAGARAAIRTAVNDREHAITQLLTARRRSAEGVLASARSLCGEPIDRDRFGWALDCVRPMIEEFHTAGGASGSELWYRQRLLARSGAPVSHLAPNAAGLARVIRHAGGAVGSQLHVSDGDLVLFADFDLGEFGPLFKDPIGLGGGDVFLIDESGHSLMIPPGADIPPTMSIESVQSCLRGSSDIVAPDQRGVVAFQAFQPVPALGPVCITARIAAAEVLAPAELLRQQLVWGGVVFAVLGALISLLAAHWIAAPVRRLAASADTLRQGKFEHGISVAGPSEIRALGRAIGAMATDLDQLITREQAARQEAQDAARSKDQFIAIISHELRTPLSAILGWSEVLRTQRLNEQDTAHGLESIQRSAEAQKRLLDDLLDVSRIVSNQLRVVSNTVDVSRAAEAAVDSLRPVADGKNVRIEFRHDSSPLLVRGDAERLQQVVSNLTSNALKFTLPGGSVRVTLRRSGASATLTVADTGIGISRALLPHIFEWFRQGDSARTRRYSGLGLGLGIVRQLVELHGGVVHAESAGEGRGATFIVTLPLLDAQASTIAAPHEAPGQTVYSRRLEAVRVLLVEDDEDMRAMVRAVLEAAGAHVNAVASAPQARRVLSENCPDVLISDIAMPDEDGYSLIRSLRASDVHVPAIALTAYARVEDAEEARAAGFQVHLTKPVTPAHLIDTVAELALASLSLKRST